MSEALRVLSISTLFPCPARPAFGKFVANQMRSVVARDDIDLTMINPLGIAPFPLSLRQPHRGLLSCPAQATAAGIAAYHPRFPALPLLGERTNARAMARAVLKLALPLHTANPFHLVDAQFFFPDGPAAALVAQALGLPLTIKARGSDIHYWGERPHALRQIRTAGAQAAALLTVSAALGRDMAALGLPHERVVVHYTGLDRARFHVTPRAQARAALGLCDAPLMVTPGALIPLKGQRLVIEALAALPDAQLALAGSGADEAGLRALAAELGLTGRVHFLGQVSHDDLPKWLSAADAVVLPSEREGLANVWIEALACGTPLVITDVGGAREVVRDARAGRLVAREPGAIAGAVRELLAAPPDQAAVAMSVAHFSWEANAAALAAIWHRAAGR